LARSTNGWPLTSMTALLAGEGLNLGKDGGSRRRRLPR
jgi:hypothetical protein